MTKQTWPEVGQVILVQDVPTTDAQRELWANRQPPTRRGEVVEVPDGDGHSGGFLTIDVGGEYGGVTYAARDFPGRYTWKPVGEPRSHRSEAEAVVKAIRQRAQENRTEGLAQEQADELLMEIRDRAKTIRTGWANPQYGTNIEEETTRLLDAFEKLDTRLSSGFRHPKDWE